MDVDVAAEEQQLVSACCELAVFRVCGPVTRVRERVCQIVVLCVCVSVVCVSAFVSDIVTVQTGATGAQPTRRLVVGDRQRVVRY